MNAQLNSLIIGFLQKLKKSEEEYDAAVDGIPSVNDLRVITAEALSNHTAQLNETVTHLQKK